MTDAGRTDPFTDIISLVAGPIAAVIRSFDQLRRGSEELMRGFENFNNTMANLNETAERINRLLNDFEEPVRAMLPQITRTVKLADELSSRMSVPIDNVIPGLTRLADTLENPVLRSFPTDLGRFMEVINDLSRRMSPLAQLAEQAGGLFGLRLPGMGAMSGMGTASTPKAAPAAAPPPATSPTPPSTSSTQASPAPNRRPAKSAAKRKAPAKKAAPRKR